MWGLLQELFDILEREGGKYTCGVWVYMVELYQDDLVDLLLPGRKDAKVLTAALMGCAANVHKPVHACIHICDRNTAKWNGLASTSLCSCWSSCALHV